MVLHIFNPEHDLALAAHLDNFTPPKAARLLRADLGFLPALWAGDGDAILVADAQCSRNEVRRVVGEELGGHELRACEFVTYSDLPRLGLTRVEPWGWDMALVHELSRHGVPSALLPSAPALENIRALSSRVTAVRLLPALMGEGRVGEAFVCGSVQEIRGLLAGLRKAVLKSPWSCSGRGLRFVADGELTPQTMGWIKNTLKTQGCVIVEPYYKKVVDFGMEFHRDGKGRVLYSGLSVFSAANGFYAGNMLASEAYKARLLCNYISAGLLREVKELICSEAGHLYNNMYEGPFGVDMMIVSAEGTDGYALHPCVEINLRRTMGHVALSLRTGDGAENKAMRIVTTDNHYKFKIQTL